MILSLFNTHVIDYVNMTLLLKDILVSETYSLFLRDTIRNRFMSLTFVLAV